MAIWHFSISLMPAHSVKNTIGYISDVLDEYVDRPFEEIDLDKETPNYWAPSDARVHADSFRELVGPETKSYSDVIQFGAEEFRDYVEIREGDLTFHFDLRYLRRELMDWIIDFACRHKLVIVAHGSGRLLEPKFEALKQELLASRAAEFARKPLESILKYGGGE